VRPRDHRSPVRSPPPPNRPSRRALPAHPTGRWPGPKPGPCCRTTPRPPFAIRSDRHRVDRGDRALPARATGRWPGPKPGPCCPPTPRPPFARQAVTATELTRVAVPFQHARLVAGQVPNSDCVVVRPRDHVRPSGVTGHRSYPAAVPSSTRESPTGQVPNPDRVIRRPRNHRLPRQESPPGNCRRLGRGTRLRPLRPSLSRRQPAGRRTRRAIPRPSIPWR